MFKLIGGSLTQAHFRGKQGKNPYSSFPRFPSKNPSGLRLQGLPFGGLLRNYVQRGVPSLASHRRITQDYVPPLLPSEVFLMMMCIFVGAVSFMASAPMRYLSVAGSGTETPNPLEYCDRASSLQCILPAMRNLPAAPIELNVVLGTETRNPGPTPHNPHPLKNVF